VHHSIVNTTFRAVIDEVLEWANGVPVYTPRVTGLAHLMGRHSFYIDSKDPTFPGFVFR
jgi:proline racemase